jgi:hypothetical protein
MEWASPGNPLYRAKLVARVNTASIRFCHIVSRVFTPVLAKHPKRFSLEDALSIGVDRMQRNFEPFGRQVESWRTQQLKP